MIRDKDEQPDKEIPRVRSGRVLSTGHLSPWRWVCPWGGCAHQPRSSPDPSHWDFMEASSHRCGQLLTPLPALFPFLEDEE